MAVALARGALGSLLALTLGALALDACVAAGTCQRDDDCPNGRCEVSGFCSIADEECETGHRYGPNAPAGQANFCVPTAGTTTGVHVPPPVSESGDDSGTEGSDDTSATSAEDTGEPECPTVAVGTTLRYFGGGLYSHEEVTPNIGDTVLQDQLELFFRLEASGTFMLGETDWASYASCPQCVTIVRDGADFFFASEGSITVAAGSAPLLGALDVTLSDIKLIEVEIDPETSATVVVDNGECLFVEDITLTAETIDGWHCPSGYFDDGSFCDCGCGLLDPDCPDTAVASCEFCNVQGSCGASHDACPGPIDPIDNATCNLELWTCEDEAFNRGDGICDCGCGFNDLDCPNALVESCFSCMGQGSCVEGDMCIGQIHPFKNGICTPIPGWTCDPDFYNGDDGCDCGCGIPDPDCPTMTLAACEFCDLAGACSDEACPGTIDPDMPWQCLPR